MNIDDKQYAVIGLGRFGLALCAELSDLGAQVLALDIDENSVKVAAEIASHAIIADCSNEDTLAELKLDEYDIVMVAIGDDINTSILTTLILKEMGVQSVWVKSKNKFHRKILQKIGADKIINPEKEMGIRVARNMLYKHVFDYSILGSGLAVVEVVIRQKDSGISLTEHLCANTDGIKVLGYKRGETIYDSSQLTVTLQIGDMLIVAGEESMLHKTMRLL